MNKSSEYKPRLYRDFMGNERWKSFNAVHLETDLWIAVSSDGYTRTIEQFSQERIVYYRHILDDHIRKFPEFLTSLVPLPVKADSHRLIAGMYEASACSGTGPMSAVAGVVAEFVCNDIIEQYGTAEAIVENGGDIFMRLIKPATISVYAGDSPLSGKIGLVIEPDQTPLSVCCSSATVGHSLSFGVADACAVACRSGALADAYATACCNAVKNIDMVEDVTEKFLGKEGILSVVVIKDDKVAIGGKLEVSVL